MHAEEDLYLLIGCHGREESGFVLCPSVSNRILKIDHTLVDPDGIIKYFDALKMFDRPLLDQNAIRQMIYRLQERYDQKFKRLWTDHEFSLLERFLVMHKQCGIYSQLVLDSSNSFVKNPQEETVLVKANNSAFAYGQRR